MMHILTSIAALTWQKNLISVTSAKKTLVRLQILFIIKPMQVRDLMKVKSRRRAATRAQILPEIRRAPWETNPINVWNVARALGAAPLFTTVIECTRGRCPTNVTCVGRASGSGHFFVFTREYKRGQSPTNVMSVGRALIRALTSLSIRESTPERNPTDVANVANALV